MSKMGPARIMKHLMPPEVRTTPFRGHTPQRKPLVDAANQAFEKGEGRLEELSRSGELDKEREYIFGKMEEQIQRLRLFGFECDAYVFAVRYARIQQQYEQSQVH